MTSIVKELRENGGWAVITRSVVEDKYIYRGVVRKKHLRCRLFLFFLFPFNLLN